MLSHQFSLSRARYFCEKNVRRAFYCIISVRMEKTVLLNHLKIKLDTENNFNKKYQNTSNWFKLIVKLAKFFAILFIMLVFSTYFL